MRQRLGPVTLGVMLGCGPGSNEVSMPLPARAEPAAPQSQAALGAGNLDSVEQLTTGLDHACALREGEVYCWGEGIGHTEDSPVAHKVAELPPIVLLSSAGRRTCALSQQGATYCWGERLGQPASGPDGAVTVVDPTAPLPSDLAIKWGSLARLDFGRPITRVEVGLTHICALTDNRDLYCWGSNNGEQITRRTPIERPLLLAAEVEAFSVGHGWTCFVREGARECLGTHPAMGELTQQQNLKFPGWIMAACGVSGDGKVSCKGDAKLVYGGGPLPDEPSEEPVEVPGLDTVEQLTLGAGHACVLRADQTVWCWGDDTFHQVPGNEDGSPVAIELPAPAVSLAAGLYHTCAVTQGAGEVVCWGHTDKGQSGESSEPSTIGLSAAPMEKRPVPTIAMDEVIARYQRESAPTPSSLDGTEWTACLHDLRQPEQRPRHCEACTYTLAFGKRHRFVADGRCPKLDATTRWEGTWKRKGDAVHVQEEASPAGTKWAWELELRGHAIAGSRKSGDVHYEVTGVLDGG